VSYITHSCPNTHTHTHTRLIQFILTRLTHVLTRLIQFILTRTHTHTHTHTHTSNPVHINTHTHTHIPICKRQRGVRTHILEPHIYTLTHTAKCTLTYPNTPKTHTHFNLG